MAHAGAAALTDRRGTATDAGGDVLKPSGEDEQEIIEGAFAACGGCIGKAAAHLDITPSTIYRKRRIWLHLGVA